VNNAGIVALGQIGKFDMAKWQQVIDVNLTGTFWHAGFGRGDEGGGRRIDHQRLIDRGHARRRHGAPVCGVQWAVRPVQVGGAGTRAASDTSELHPPPVSSVP
jgi:NAD(P)-dependent dehydrogenase (short-subunit alcohol dehydrogenase family)